MSFQTYEESAHSGSKVELYLFATEDGLHRWAYTTDRVSIHALGVEFVPYPISRGELRQAAGESSGERLTITVPYDNPVAAMHVPYLPPRPIRVTVYSYQRRDLSVEIIQGFTGYVAAFAQRGEEADLSCTQIIDTFQQQVPWAVFSSRCIWATYEEGCGVDKSAFKTVATITGIDGSTISSADIAAAGAGEATNPDWFQAGFAVNPKDGAVRFIVAQSLGGQVKLVHPFPGLEIGDTVDLYAGDDQTEVTCREKFNNKRNRIAFDHLPTFNVFERGTK